LVAGLVAAHIRQTAVEQAHQAGADFLHPDQETPKVVAAV